MNAVLHVAQLGDHVVFETPSLSPPDWVPSEGGGSLSAASNTLTFSEDVENNGANFPGTTFSQAYSFPAVSIY